MTHLALSLRKFPKLRERVIEGFANEPKLFQHFLSANMGLVHPLKLDMRQVWGFGKGAFPGVLQTLPHFGLRLRNDHS